ncbi:MAG: hypothetical protein GX943_04040 [Candidatus Pacebacteria bacterium]|jgi:hypothetical protein|nr:hypothetical protein [Candidatus Paceibacterota bacterium]
MPFDTEEKPFEQVNKEPKTPEEQEKQKKASREAQRLLSGEKMRLILKDENCKQALYACLRTFANLGISVADTFPGLGEIPSWTADAIKFLKIARAKNIARKKEGSDGETNQELNNFWGKIDLSPDVSPWVASGSEVLEPMTGTAFPSHIIETTLQLTHDWPRIKEGLRRIKEIMGTQTVKELKALADNELIDYQANKEPIDSAIKILKN